VIDTNSPTAPRRVTAAERRKQAVLMRQAGATYEAIGEKLGISPQAAHKTVDKALTKTQRETSEAADKVRQIELSRLDAMQAALWLSAVKGNHGAVDRILRIMERRARYLGLDALDESANELQWQDIAKRLGLEPAEVKEMVRKMRSAREGAQTKPAPPQEPDDGE